LVQWSGIIHKGKRLVPVRVRPAAGGSGPLRSNDITLTSANER
jgi:hypothetical protein